MSLVTLEINDIADVIDEAINRHVLVAHNDNKASKLVGDILSFRSDIVELQKRFSDDTRFSEIRSFVDIRLSAIEASLLSARDIFEKYKLIEDKLGSFVSYDNLTKELEYVKNEFDVGKNKLQEYVVSFIKNEIGSIPVPKNGLPGEPGKDGISVNFDDVKTFILETLSENDSKTLLNDESLKTYLDRNIEELEESITKQITTVKEYIVPFVKDEISKLPVPEDGLPGTDGVDGTSITLDDVRPFILSEIQNHISNLPVPKDGVDGAPGIDGVDGKDGKDGVGLAGAMIDRSGNLHITLTNGNVVPLGAVVGKDGIHGTDGVDGINGINGNDGADGADGNSVTIDDVLPTLMTHIENVLSKIPTPKDGKDGIDGVNGTNGIDGIDGKNVSIEEAVTAILPEIERIMSSLPPPKDGVDGKDGTDGTDGIDGKSVSIDDVIPHINSHINEVISQLPVPKDGKDGEDGKDGNNGVDGTNGVSVTVDDVIPHLLPHILTHVERLVPMLPMPKDGKDGIDGKNGVDGQTPSIDDIVPYVKSYISETISQLPMPKDGKDGDPGKDAVIDVEQLRSIYLEDVEERFNNVYVTLQNEKDEIRTYIGDKISKSIPSIDFDSIIDGKLTGLLRQDDVENFVTREIDTLMSKIRTERSEVPSIIEEEIPDDVAEKVAKAISIVAESPSSIYVSQQPPVVVNVSQPSSPSKPKRIVLRRDKDGNATADVTDE